MKQRSLQLDHFVRYDAQVMVSSEKWGVFITPVSGHFN